MSRKVSAKQIGKRIKELREANNLKVTDVAKALRVTRQHIYHIEAGNKNVTVERLQQLSHVLKVSEGQIIRGDAA